MNGYLGPVLRINKVKNELNEMNVKEYKICQICHILLDKKLYKSDQSGSVLRLWTKDHKDWFQDQFKDWSCQD